MKGLDIIKYQSGEMSEEEVVSFFQDMMDTGLVWRLSSHYGNKAYEMIQKGLCILGEEGTTDYSGRYIPSRYEVVPGSIGSVEWAQKVAHSRL